MSCEPRRGCGFRKVGGLYLVGDARGFPCDRLPIPLEICPCCGAGIKQTQGFTWVDITGLVGGSHNAVLAMDGAIETPAERLSRAFEGKPLAARCKCPANCPLCHNVQKIGRGGLLWIGAQFYATIEAFEVEARTLGISRRIATVPHDFELGKTFMLLAHPRGVIKPTGDLTAKYIPAIFRVWKPERLERIYRESDRNSARVAADIARGITPVFFPDADTDHQGSVYDTCMAETGSTPSMFSEE